MAEQDKLRVAMALIGGRLHTAVGGKQCGCGQCSHQVAMAARRAGISRQQLETALAPVATPERARRRVRREPMRARICDSSTIRPRGHEGDRAEVITALLSRLHGG